MSKLINAEVNHINDIQAVVKNYINNQTHLEQSPFKNLHINNKSSEVRSKKTSLTDWRALYNLNNKRNFTVRHHNSDRKFDKTNRTPVKTRISNRTHDQVQNRLNKTTHTFRQSFIQSALVQNYYENQYIDQRKIHTAKIRRHYQKDTQRRPVSIHTITRRKHQQQQRKQDQVLNNQKLNNDNRKVLKSICTEKYQTIKINRKYIRKHNDIVIQGLKVFQKQKLIQGLRYYAKQQ